MKNIFSVLLIVFVLLLLSGCEEEMIVRNGNGNLIIEYTNEPQALMNHKYYIRIYDNKEIEYGLEDDIKKTTISQEQYDEILKMAFSKKILSLDGKPLYDPNVLDGYYTYITIYNENGSSVRIGGSNPNNKSFNKLEHLINECVKE